MEDMEFWKWIALFSFQGFLGMFLTLLWVMVPYLLALAAMFLVLLVVRRARI